MSMSHLRVDDILSSWIVSIGGAGAAGAIDITIAGVTVVVDRSDPARILELRVPHVSEPTKRDQLAVVRALAGESAAAAIGRGDAEATDIRIAPNLAACRAVGRLAAISAVRGEGSAWDAEAEMLHARARNACGVADVAVLPDVAEWLDGEADDAIVPSAEVLEDSEHDDPFLVLGQARRAAQIAAEVARVGDLPANARWRSISERNWRRLSVLAPDGIREVIGRAEITLSLVEVDQEANPHVITPLCLTERRVLSPVTVYRLRGGVPVSLVGAPAGPAGTTALELDDLSVVIDMTEPTRFVTAEVGASTLARLRLPADFDGEDLAGALVRYLQPVMVLLRDVELGIERGSAFRPLDTVLARVELATELARLDLAGATARARKEAELAIGELVELLDRGTAVSANALTLIRRLDGLVDVEPVLGRGARLAAADLGTSLASQPPEVGDPAGQILDALDRGRIEPLHGAVDLDESARAILGESSTLSVHTLRGPVAQISISMTANPERRVRLRLHQDLELVGETVIGSADFVATTVDLAGVPTHVDVELVEPLRGVDAAQLCRWALTRELVGQRGPAAEAWLSGAAAWADTGNSDLAAIAFERAARLTSPVLGWSLLRRAVVMGTGWASGRPRPGVSFSPVWLELV